MNNSNEIVGRFVDIFIDGIRPHTGLIAVKWDVSTDNRLTIDMEFFELIEQHVKHLFGAVGFTTEYLCDCQEGAYTKIIDAYLEKHYADLEDIKSGEYVV